MAQELLDRLHTEIQNQGRLPIELELEYTVIFSTLHGNLPINKAVKGILLDMPVDLELEYIIIPNTKGSFPVNTKIHGTIGEFPISADMTYKIVFSTIAGNIPVNTGIKWKANGKNDFLRMDYSLVPAMARGELATSSGGGGKKRVSAPKFKGGKMVEENEMGNGAGGGASEAGRPVNSVLYGIVDHLEIHLKFNYTYYCNTSSGRNPINIGAKGFILPSS